jgi:hypothetical protein
MTNSRGSVVSKWCIKSAVLQSNKTGKSTPTVYIHVYATEYKSDETCFVHVRIPLMPLLTTNLYSGVAEDEYANPSPVSAP